MNFREARKEDIENMHKVRVAVRENPLPHPDLISADDYNDFMFHRGKGWVCESENNIVGFAIIDLKEHNVWALFIQPGYEGKGVGRRLHDEMLNWYFTQTDQTIWLGTAPNTRAERFYDKAGWKRIGIRANGEIKFEMTKDDWSVGKGKTA